MSNKKQVELTDITAPLLAATQGFSMDVNQTTDFLLDFAEGGRDRGLNRGERLPSVSKVSRILRDLSESSFNPQLVSIGPIHRENEKLKEFEWLKGCYLDDLLNRCDSTPKEILEACLQKVITLIPQIRESYNAGVIENYSEVELATMMVKDGCFILEFCFKHEEEYLYLPNKMQNIRIAMDLMLLENQVPFVVLQALFDCSMGEMSFTLSDVLDCYLAPYIKLFYSLLPEKNSILSNVLDICLAPCIKLFYSLLPEKFSTTDVDSYSTYSYSTHDHVLGYLHKRYSLIVPKSSNLVSMFVDEERKENTYTTFQTIVELDRSGMNFKPHQEDEWSMTIKFQSSLFACLPWFWRKPALLMPALIIDDFTELILRNFVAYEQLFLQDRYYFSSYAIAMDRLIDTQEDIAKLVESKVLVNTLGSNEEAADMINKISKNMYITEFYYTQEFKRMDKHYNGFWTKPIACVSSNIAWLRRVYFNNPWNAIALLGAIILFALTVVQTLFTVLGYFADRSNQ